MPSVIGDGPVSLRAYLQEERRAHAQFAESRRHVYLEDDKLMAELDAFALAEGGGERSGIVVTGERGAGKSALLVNWTTRFKRAHPDAFVIEHYFGARTSMSTHVDLVRHVITEIAVRRDLAEAIPAGADELIEELPLWLARSGGQGLVLVVDGVDQDTGVPDDFRWLPEFLPSGIRWIVSARSDSIERHLISRGWTHCTIDPLSSAARRQIAEGFLRTAASTLSPSLVERVISSAAAANPLFLRTSLEELRRTESRADAKRIDHFLEAGSAEVLFARILESLDRELDPEITRDVLGQILISRHGRTVRELTALTRGGSERVGAVLTRLRSHLMLRDGRYDFVHEVFRGVVSHRIDSEPGHLQSLHRTAAIWLSSEPIDETLAEELPWHWLGAGDVDAAVSVLLRPDVVLKLTADELDHRLAELWLRVVSEDADVDIVALYDRRLKEFDRTATTVDRITLRGRLAHFYLRSARYNAAISLIDEQAALAESLPGKSGHLHAARSRHDLGRVLLQLGQLELAESTMRSALEVFADADDRCRLAAALVERDLAAVLYERSDYSAALELAQMSLDSMSELAETPPAEFAKSMGDVAAILLRMHRIDEANELFERAEGRLRQLYGTNHPETAAAINNRALALLASGSSEDAFRLLEIARGIWEEMLGPDHPNVGRVLANLGYVRVMTGGSQEAVQYYERALEVYERWQPEGSMECASVVSNLALACYDQGEFERAGELFERVAAITSRLVGTEHIDYVQAQLELARVELRRCRFDVARGLYDRYLPIKRRLLGENHPSYLRTLANYHELDSMA